jgi:hypothetical protein
MTAPSFVTTGADAMDGEFAHMHVRLRWTLEEDGEYGEGGGKQWVFDVSLGDIGVSRRYPSPLSRDEADQEARKIAPELFRIAEAWLK